MRALLALTAVTSLSAFAATPPNSWVLLDGGENHMHGSTHDLKRAQQVTGAKNRAFWFRTDAGEFVLYDSDTIEAVRATFKPLERIGHEMEKVGERQSEIGEQQSEIGERMAAKAERHSQKARRASRHRVESADDEDDSLTELGDQMEALGKVMEKFGKKMEAFGKEMEAASKKMNAEVAAIIEEAAKKGLIKPVKA